MSGLWQDLIKAKYLFNQYVASMEARVSDIPYWKALLKMKDIFQRETPSAS
jgi:hypothetical protein